MGYYVNSKNIKCFDPDNDDDTLYIVANEISNIADLIERCKAHFGEGVDINNLKISSQSIQTRCIGYDIYDSSDYDDFIIITKEG